MLAHSVPATRLSKLKLVRMGRPISRPEQAALAARIKEAFCGLVGSINLVDFDSPDVEEIEADLLTQDLDQRLGGHILGITDADLLDRSATDFFRFMFGCKDNRNHVALVSTRRISTADPTRSITRLLKVGLHELGHNFGLVHHYSFEKTGDGGYCPMTKGDYNRHGERSYKRSVIDARGFRFCHACRRFLRLAHGSAS